MNRSENKKDAVEAMARFAADVDPLYLPGSFLLGCLCLQLGDAQNAIAAFEPIIENYRHEVSVKTAILRQKYVAVPIPIPAKLVRHFGFIQRWAQYYLDGMAYLRGGSYYMAAEAWQDLKRELSDRNDAGRPRSSEIHNALIDSIVKLLQSTLGHLEVPLHAAGRGGATEEQQRIAQAVLDNFLDQNNLRMVNIYLTDIEMTCLLAGILESYKSESQKQQVQEKLQKIEAFEISKLVKRELAELRDAVGREDWDLAKEKVIAIRRKTGEPDDHKFSALLNDSQLDTFECAVASWYLPGLRELRRLRNERPRKLYVESIYQWLRALVLSYEPGNLTLAIEEADKFRSVLQQKSVVNLKLRILTLSVQVEATMRLLELPPSVDSFIVPPADEQSTTLKKAANNERLPAESRAVALVALGLIERGKRKGLKEGRHKRSKPDESLDKLERFNESAYYTRALALTPSASAYCYIAECAIEENRWFVARSHIRQALELSPEHILAKQLLNTLPPHPSPPQGPASAP